MSYPARAEGLVNSTNKANHFVKERYTSKLLRKNKNRSLLLDGYTNWDIATDLEHHFVYPTEIALMTQRRGIVFCSVNFKKFSLLS